MHPAQPSKARLGGVHFIFWHIQIFTGLLQDELFKVTMYTVNISSNGSHFFTASVLVYWTYKVSKMGYGRTKWMVTMYPKYTSHISSNGSHFWWLCSWCTEHIRSAHDINHWTYKVCKFGYGQTKVRVTMYSIVYCTYKLEWKPLFDGWGQGVLNI